MIDNKKVVAIVTAREGSKGLPNKNFMSFNGKPLFIWSVEAAMKSKYIDMVVIAGGGDRVWDTYQEYVSSPSFTVYKNSGSRGNFPIYYFRSKESMSDTSKNEEALIETIESIEENFNEDFLYGQKHRVSPMTLKTDPSRMNPHTREVFIPSLAEVVSYKNFKADIVVNLQPTSPYRKNGFIDDCLETYINNGHDSLLAAGEVTPFLWGLNKGKWEFKVDCGACNRKMRQALTPEELLYHDSGSIYVTDREVLFKTGCRVGDNPYIYATEGLSSMQIDSELDFKMFEILIKEIHGNNST